MVREITYNQGNTLLMGNLGNSLKIGYIVLGVTNALDVDSLGLVVNGSGNGLWVVAVDKLGVDAKAGKEDLELVVGATVKVGGGDDVVASMGEGVDGNELSGLAGGGSQSSDTTLKGSYPLLEDIDSGLLR